MTAIFGKPKNINTKNLIIKPKKLYVISSSDFDSQQEAINKLMERDVENKLDPAAKVYEVSKSYLVVKEIKLKEANRVK